MESRDPREDLSPDPSPDRGDALGAFLRAAARAPFAWGARDCALTMADWCRAEAGIDPAAPLRGRYRTARGASRHARRRGGLEALGRTLMAEAGFALTDVPAPGDVGIVRHPAAGPAFAIRCALGWAVKAPAGIAVGPYPTLAAWRLAPRGAPR